VTGPNGRGRLWVIAETKDLPTRFARHGRDRRPGPLRGARPAQAKYKVWVRGYGLVDSPIGDGEPGKALDLRARAGANERPRRNIIRRSMVFDAEDPGRRSVRRPRRYSVQVKQIDWLNLVKNNGCVGCHQLGQRATRTIPSAFGDMKSSEEAWSRRIQSGQAGEQM